jgi:DNA-directed RNA polymerase specialized sigma subunit
MGREEKRLRKRTTQQLERRLGRKPTDEEVQQAIADLRETQRKTTGWPGAGRPRAAGRS